MLKKIDVESVNYKPMTDKILVLPDEPELVSKGGIIIPDTASVIPSRGVVIAVGDECKYCQIGHRVVYGKSTGFIVELEGKMYKMMQEHDVLLMEKK